MDNAEIKRRLTTLRDEAKLLQEDIHETIGDASNGDDRDEALDNLQGELRDIVNDLGDYILGIDDMPDEGDGVEEEDEDEVEEAEPEK